jgi:hypothetical protein
MTISKRSLLTAITMALISMSLVVISTSAQAQTRIKCWENSDGVRECSKNVPPEYSQQGHEEINTRGITVETSDRAKTDEERAEEDRLATIQEEEDKRKAQAAAQDKILLYTYSNTDDIQMASNGKIAVLESNIKLATKRKEKIQANLDKDTATAAAEELAGKQPSEDLLTDIKSLERQARDLDKFVADRRLEQEAIKKDYAEKIVRYNELTGN